MLIVEQAFWGLGSNAAPAIPALTQLMYNTNVQVAMNAVTALSGGASPNLLPALLQAAADPACTGRYGAIDAIGRCGHLGTNAKPIVPVLVRCTQDKEPQIVTYAVRSLANLAIEPAISVPAIEEALKHRDDAVRRAATNALASFAINTQTNSAGH
jgi:hypothetical protein